jgi:hypothetical protein
MAPGAVRRIAAAVIALGMLPVPSAAQRLAKPSLHLRKIRFSLDGRYVLAQDDSEVAILTVQPLAVLFRIPSGTSTVAQFTPDSREVVLLSSSTRAGPWVVELSSSARVERWRIADRAQAGSTPVPKLACGSELLSPDGHVFACNDFEGTLRLIDLASGQTILERKDFVKRFLILTRDQPARFVGNLGGARMTFSPDGRFFVALPAGGAGRVIAWDTREKTAVNISGAPKWTTGSSMVCAFVAPDRLMISFGRGSKGRLVTASLVELPSGQVLMKPQLPPGSLFSAADPSFVLVRAFGSGSPDGRGARAAAVEFAAGRVFVSKSSALDVFGTHLVAERRAGEIGLFDRSKGLQTAVVIAGKPQAP